MLGLGERVPPQVPTVEKQLLAMVITNQKALDHALLHLEPGYFYKASHQRVFEAICTLRTTGGEIDTISIAAYLRQKGCLDEIGGETFLAELYDDYHTTGYKAACQEILETHGRRTWIQAAHEILELAYQGEGNLTEITAQSNVLCANASKGKNSVTWKRLGEHLPQVFNWAEKAQGNGGVSGMSTGFRELDRVTTGLHPGDLWIVAARPGMGKTSLAMKMGIEAAKRGESGALFSLEMPSLQLAMRALCMEASVSLSSLRGGTFNKRDMSAMGTNAGDLFEIPFYLDDTPSMNISQLAAKARILKREHGLQWLLIDYLQLMDLPGKDSMTNELGNVSRGLKQLAKELDIPVVALSQLSRAVEQRAGDKKPQLSDLRSCMPTDEWVYTPLGPVQFKDKPNSVCAQGMTGNVPAKSKYIYKKTNYVYTIKTKFGNFRATAKHWMLTGLGWKRVRDLVPGEDVIASPNYITSEDTGPQPHARLLGWLLGNGYLSGTPSLVLRNELIPDLYDAAQKIGIGVTIGARQKSPNVKTCSLSDGLQSGSLSNPVMMWLRSLKLEGKTSHDKFIPQSYLTSDPKTKVELIRGLWETNGTVTRGHAKYCTVSELLARQISWMLLTIGIKSKVLPEIHKGPSGEITTMHIVSIATDDNDKFAQCVTKTERFGVLKLTATERYRDPAPGVLVKLLSELSMVDENIRKVTNKYRLQKRQDGRFKQFSRKRYLEITDQINCDFLKQFPYTTMTDVSWGNIYSIEKSSEEVNVADLSVDHYHNFVVNGVVAHNSGAIEQDSDGVIFVYREGQYKSDVDPSHAELILGKQRNGPCTTVSVRFDAEYTRFADKEPDTDGHWADPADDNF